MGYNQGLAVGLAIGIPCALILAGSIFFYTRHKRLQQEEDRRANDLDVELRDDGLFKEFGEALHRPYDQSKSQKYISEAPGLDKSSMSADTASHLRESVTTPPQSFEKRKLAAALSESIPGSTVGANGTANSTANGTGSLGPQPVPPPAHSKTSSSYDFYDTFIPILPSSEQQELGQPPAIAAASDRQSMHSSNNTSIIQADTSSRSLDNLAKQLQGPQFFEKLPSRAGTISQKHRSIHQSLPTPSATDLVVNPYDHGGINDNFVNDRTSPLKNHPYREKLVGRPAEMPTLGLENNFDNNIRPDADYDSEPDVIFK